jgi:hypothetical protein
MARAAAQGRTTDGRTTMRRCTSKIYASVLAVAVAVIVSLASRPAKACGSGGMGSALAVVGVVAIGTLAADVAFTGYDLVQAAQEERASKGMAIAEVAVTAPQFVIGGLVLSSMRYNNDAIVPAIYVAWTGALMGHGIGTLATMPRGPEPLPDPKRAPLPSKDNSDWTHSRDSDHPRVSVAPTMLSDGRSALMPGISAVGTF